MLKKEIEKLDRNIKCVENDLLDREEVSLKLTDEPCTIVCSFNKFKEKEEILTSTNKLNNTGIYICQDF